MHWHARHGREQHSERQARSGSHNDRLDQLITEINQILQFINLKLGKMGTGINTSTGQNESTNLVLHLQH